MQSILFYDKGTGEFTWKERPKSHFKNLSYCKRWNMRYAGTKAGTIDGKGYSQINIRSKLYRAHRVAWLCTYGEWPVGEIDHINGIKTDNAITNLREATHSQNNMNREATKNTSGARGVYWNKARSKWQAQIKLDRKCMYLGSFDNLEDAAKAYDLAASKYHKEFARINSIT